MNRQGKRAAILGWLEQKLSLRIDPRLDKSLRAKRVFKAVWLRPQTLLKPREHTEASWVHVGWVYGLVSNLIKNAAIDLLGPPWAVLTKLLRPLKKLRRSSGKLLDGWIQNKPVEYNLTSVCQKIFASNWLFVPVLLLAIALFILVAQASLPLTGQWVFVVVCYGFALLFKRMPQRFSHLCLMTLTLLLLARYMFWRFTSSLDLASGIEIFLGYTLVLAESYTWLVLIFGFIQTAWPLQRKPVPLKTDIQSWPHVDVFIPTYNEPLSVVKPTVYAARGLDWPGDKINVYLLDDGHRPAFEAFAQEAGVNYISRPDNAHAKAGNINHALQQTHGEFIAIFDCDHIPTRSFLQTTMGWFEQDPQCALVQTPHHFFSADPFERNFNLFRQMPNEGNLFYGLIQDGNDYWNSAFFCGSCAVIQRKALLEVGGIATETVTEDAHTSLKLHAKGYNSVYLGNIQAAGLATETLADHIGQRIRWARGMAQIFRVDNPFLKKGLTAFQRVCYGNAMLHFLRFAQASFLVMPMAYLYFEFHLLNAAAVTILSYALPQLIIASYTNSIIQGRYRRSFWSEVYETVLSWYIVLPTTLAFINPRLGKFNVTSKGGLINQGYFDANIARPYLILLLINLIGFVIGLARLFFWNTYETGTVLMNMLWCSLNLAILGAAVGVATEAVQKHIHHRVRMVIPAFLRLPGGHTLNCHTEEYSSAGLTLAISEPARLREFSNVSVGLHRGDREFLFPATLHFTQGQRVEAVFTPLTPAQQAQLIQCTFGRADAWLNWQEHETKDRALSGLKDVFLKGLIGYKRLFSWIANGLKYGWQRMTADKTDNTAEWET